MSGAPHTWTVGDRATIITSDGTPTDVTTVSHVNRRVTTQNANGRAEWHVPAYGNYWTCYGGFLGRLRPYQAGDDDRVSLREKKDARTRAASVAAYEKKQIEHAERDVERARERLANARISEMRAQAALKEIDVAIDALAAKIAEGGAT